MILSLREYGIKNIFVIVQCYTEYPPKLTTDLTDQTNLRTAPNEHTYFYSLIHNSSKTRHNSSGDLEFFNLLQLQNYYSRLYLLGYYWLEILFLLAGLLWLACLHFA